jgi:hypothetical protein
MKRPSTSLLALLLTLIAAPALAQTRPFVPPNTTFRVVLDHDGVNTVDYHLFLCTGAVTSCATEIAAAPVSSRTNGSVSFDVTGRPVGTYTLQASARNADQREAASAVLVFDVRLPLPLPNAPTIRIVAISTTADGRASMRYLELAELRQLLTPPMAELRLPSFAEPEPVTQ